MRTISSTLVGFAIASTTPGSQLTRQSDPIASSLRSGSSASESNAETSTGSAIHAAIGAGAVESLQVATNISATSAAVPSLRAAMRASAVSHNSVTARAAIDDGDASSNGVGAAHPRSATPMVNRKRSSGRLGSGRESNASRSPCGASMLTRAAMRARVSAGARSRHAGSMRVVPTLSRARGGTSIGTAIARNASVAPAGRVASISIGFPGVAQRPTDTAVTRTGHSNSPRTVPRRFPSTASMPISTVRDCEPATRTGKRSGAPRTAGGRTASTRSSADATDEAMHASVAAREKRWNHERRTGIPRSYGVTRRSRMLSNQTAPTSLVLPLATEQQTCPIDRPSTRCVSPKFCP